MPSTASTASEAEGLLRPFLEEPGAAAVLTDFDGTLSAIVDDPGRAGPVPGALEVLGRLAERYGLVGVVSGRPVSYLMERLGEVEQLVLVGLYGLERAVGDRIETLPGAEAWAGVVAAAASDAEATAPPGVGVERKGLTVTLHVRTAPQHTAWIEQFGRQQAESRGLESHPGRLSIELRPPVPVDKGTVVAQLAAGYRAVCYCGDDRGDLPAFAALARLRAGGVATLALAAASEESPPELMAAADLAVDGPGGVVALLRRLVA